jgi:hypothetical protein
MENNLIIAKTIIQQLGGNKFIVMTGARNIFADGQGVTMQIMKNKSKAKYVSIILNSLDLYDMQFKSLDKDLNLIIRAEANNIYFEDLETIFTNITGLNTRL